MNNSFSEKDERDVYFINYLTEIEKENIISNNPFNIFYIKNPSEELIFKAIKIDGNTIQLFDSQTYNMQLTAVRQNGESIRYIKNPTEEIKREAIKNNPKALAYIVEKDILEIIEHDNIFIQYIPDPTEKMQIVAVVNNLRNIRNIKNPTENVQLLVVRQDGLAVKYIKNPTEKVQIAAVKQNKLALQIVNYPSEKLSAVASKTHDDIKEQVYSKYRTSYPGFLGKLGKMIFIKR